MKNTLVDIRWILLNFVNNPNIIDIQKFLFGLSFLFLIFTSFIYLAQNHLKFIKKNRYLLSDNIFIFSIILFIIIGRWTSLLVPNVNPDESQFIAGAIKLFKDPVFWQSVDTGSSGPLNIFPLELPVYLGIRLEYASARLVATLLVFISILSLYYSLNIIYNKSIARSSVFLVVVTFSVMPIYDLKYYASEYVPITLLTLSLMTICLSYRYPKNELRIVSGLLLGAIPVAKFQGLPIAFAIVLLAIHIIWKQSQDKTEFSKSIVLLGLSFLIPSLIIFAYLIRFSLIDDFWKSYIQQNLLNYSSGTLKVVNNSTKSSHIGDHLGYIFNLFFSTRVLFCLAAAMLIVLIPILIYFQYFKIQKTKRSRSFYLIYYSILQLIFSLYAVLKPANQFYHYLLFLIIPCGFLIGVCLGELQIIAINSSLKKSLGNLPIKLLINFLLYIIIVGIAQGLFYIKYDDPNLLRREQLLKHYHGPLETAITQIIHPGETMVVWGWAPELYVETATIQGVRDAVPASAIIPSPLQKYYLKRFIDDLAKSSAPVFVDAVSPKMFTFHDPKTQEHEAFPELNKIITEKYKLVDNIDGVRIYKLNSP